MCVFGRLPEQFPLQSHMRACLLQVSSTRPAVLSAVLSAVPLPRTAKATNKFAFSYSSGPEKGGSKATEERKKNNLQSPNKLGCGNGQAFSLVKFSYLFFCFVPGITVQPMVMLCAGGHFRHPEWFSPFYQLENGVKGKVIDLRA